MDHPVIENSLKIRGWDEAIRLLGNRIREKSAEYALAVAELLYDGNDVCDDTIKMLCEMTEAEYNLIKSDSGMAWAKATQQIAKFMAINHRLFWEPKRYVTSDMEHDVNVRLIDLVYLVYLKCILCAGGCRLLTPGSATYHFKATDIEYVKNSSLCFTKRKLSRYRTGDVMRALDRLNTCWLKLRYSLELVKYIQMLEYRLAQIMCFPMDKTINNFEVYREEVGSDEDSDDDQEEEKEEEKEEEEQVSMLDDISNKLGGMIEDDEWWMDSSEQKKSTIEEKHYFKQAVSDSGRQSNTAYGNGRRGNYEKPDLFIGNMKLLNFASLRCVNMNRAIFVYTCIKERSREKLLKIFYKEYSIQEYELNKITARVRKYLINTAETTVDETTEASLTSTFMALSCNQSLVEQFMIKHLTGRTTIIYNRKDPSRILCDCSTTGNCNSVTLESQKSPAEMVKIKPEHNAFAAVLVMMSMMEKAFKGRSNVSFTQMCVYRNYITCTFDREKENLDVILDSDLPMLVQTFNHFKLCWLGKQYETKDVEEAIASMLVFLCKAHDCKLEYQDLSNTMYAIIGDDWRKLMRFY